MFFFSVFFSINRINGDETVKHLLRREEHVNRAMLFGEKSVTGYFFRKLAYPHNPPKGPQGGDIVWISTHAPHRVGLSNISVYIPSLPKMIGDQVTNPKWHQRKSSTFHLRQGQPLRFFRPPPPPHTHHHGTGNSSEPTRWTTFWGKYGPWENTVCHVLCIAEDSRTHFIVDL